MSDITAENLDFDAIDDNTFVTVSLASEIYGVRVNKVHEVIGWSDISKIPNSLPFLRGVITLRGVIVPIVDLRIKFDIKGGDEVAAPVIIITEIEERKIGIIVDSVSDVITIPEDSIQRTVHFSANVRADCIEGFNEINDKIIILIDIDKLFTDDELEIIKESG